MGVGMPYSLLLQQFGEHVWRAFGHMSYHVGSSLAEKHGWRDVDVRLLLPDEQTYANATEKGQRSALFVVCEIKGNEKHGDR